MGFQALALILGPVISDIRWGVLGYIVYSEVLIRSPATYVLYAMYGL